VNAVSGLASLAMFVAFAVAAVVGIESFVGWIERQYAEWQTNRSLRLPVHRVNEDDWS
jgi:hypothetical protein